MKALYKFNFDCGRMGTLRGLFIAEQDEIDEAIGKECDFGEALGKHSYIHGPLEEDEVEEVTTSKVVLNMIKNYDLEIGYNPLNYLVE